MTAEAAAFEQVRNAIVVASEQGSTVEESDLREEFGIGHGDLTEVLNDLRDKGEAVNETPGEWRAPYEDEREAFAAAEAAERREARAADDDDEDDEELPPAARAGSARVAPARTAVIAGDGEVVLTKGVLNVMDDETIGKIVKAGVEESDGDEFTLRVAL